MSEANRKDELIDRFWDYLQGELTPQQAAALEKDLSENPEAIAACKDLAELAVMAREACRREGAAQDEMALDADAQQQQSLALAELAKLEAQADAELTDLSLKPARVKVARVKVAVDQGEDPGSLSAHDLAAVGGYLLRKAALSKPAIYAYAAAVAILALVLINPWGGANDPIINTPTAQQDPQQQAKQVATLTATHNAAWSGAASAAPAHGTPLYPNQRLTLTQGFAQITTTKGAKAIIQAPATIELINNNAIHLHAGKLVGICETQSSKRFLVRTPHMDITDLGTRFGVDASRPDLTEAHVLDGEIQVTRRSPQGGPAASETLRKGQAVRADSRSAQLTRIRSTNPAFVTAMPDQFLPEGTGFGLAQGDTDPNWRIVAIDGQPVTEGGEMQVIYPSFGDPRSSRWLHVPRELVPQKDVERTITCRVTLRLPSALDPNRSELIMGFMADHNVVGIRINGTSLTVPENKLQRSAPLNELPILAFTRPGDNTIEVDIYDINAHSALNVAFEVRASTP